MGHRRVGPALLAIVLAATAHAAVSGQATPPSRTPWGDPDLQGVWNNNTVVPLQRPRALAGRQALTAEEVAERFHRTSSGLFPQDHSPTPPPREGASYNEFWFEWGADTNRTALIVDPPDGRLPALTASAARRLAAAPFSYGGSGGLDSWAGLSLFERCITRGMPGAVLPGFYNHNYHILQTPDYVVIVYEMLHDARIIPLGGGGRPAPGIRQWLGVPRGRWDGETLVVETTRFNDRANQRGPGGGGAGAAMIFTDFSASRHARLVERFTRVAADAIDYQFTLDDPTEFTRPFTVAIPMRRTAGTLFEYACHEGNYGLVNGLRSARFEERGGER